MSDKIGNNPHRTAYHVPPTRHPVSHIYLQIRFEAPHRVPRTPQPTILKQSIKNQSTINN